MIAILALALAAPPASVDGLPLGGLTPQALPAKGCAAYLFTAGATRVFVAMASAEPAALRVALDGAPVDLAGVGAGAATGFGLSGTNDYRGAGISASLDLAIETRGDVSKGAVIPRATLRIDREGKDGVVVPLVGIVGCA